MTTPPSRGRREKGRTDEEAGDVVHVGGLKLKEVEEGRVVDGERGPRRGDARGIGGKAV